MTSKHVPSILLVDNESKWSRAASVALEQHGKHLVRNAPSIEAALDFPYCDGFALILIDAKLAFDGDISDLMEILRLYPGKVLVVSDVFSITEAIRAFKMGANYAERPFEPKRVLELVALHLRSASVTIRYST